MAEPYASTAQIQTVLESLAVDLTSEGGSEFGETKGAALLTEASAFIDGYLAAVYEVPIPDASTRSRAILRPHCVNVFRALAMGNRLADNAVAKALFDATIAWLTLVSKGRIPLPNDAPPIDVTAENALVGYYTSNDVVYPASKKGML